MFHRKSLHWHLLTVDFSVGLSSGTGLSLGRSQFNCINRVQNFFHCKWPHGTTAAFEESWPVQQRNITCYCVSTEYKNIITISLISINQSRKQPWFVSCIRMFLYAGCILFMNKFVISKSEKWSFYSRVLISLSSEQIITIENNISYGYNYETVKCWSAE